MAVYTGIKNRFAIQKATTWGTLVDATTGDLFPVDSESLTSDTERLPNNELNDTVLMSPGASGKETVGGAITRKLHYQGDHVPLAIGLGTAGNPAQVGTTSFYTHTLIPAGTLEGLFLSLFSDRENSTVEIDSAKVDSFTIRGDESSGRVMIVYNMVGRDYDNSGNLTWASATEASEAALNYVNFAHGTFQYAASQGSAVDTAIYPSAFEVTFANSLERFWSAENYPNIDEPVRNGFGLVSGSMTFPHDEANPWNASKLSQTPITMSWDFASGDYSFNIDLPYVVVTGPTSPTTSGPGRQGLTMGFTTEKAASSPTGMGSTLPHIVNVNADSANPLG